MKVKVGVIVGVGVLVEQLIVEIPTLLLVTGPPPDQLATPKSAKVAQGVAV